MTDTTAGAARPAAETTTFAIILAISLCHLLNDVMQSLLTAIYPILKDGYHLDFWQIGLLTLVFQVTASLLQPAIGLYTDKRPMPRSLPFGMASTMLGLFLLAFGTSFTLLLAGAALIGIGSAVFHPEASRVARMASGGRYGLAQSLFQVGGNFGQAIGPLLAAFIVVPRGQTSIAWFSLVALTGMVILWRVGTWYGRTSAARAGRPAASRTLPLPRRQVTTALVVLTLLVFTKNIYTASISSYYTFYLIDRFGLDVEHSQLMLFLFLGAMALGTVLGGPIGDRFGSKTVIWFSILGVLPFTLMLPYADLFWSGVLSFIIGVVLASAFPAIVVFAQELVPGRVGMIAGIFFGFAFGMGGIAAAVLGVLADRYGIAYVYQICSYLPFLGLLTIFLPSRRGLRAA
ncbi:MFS transporter [Prosthecomicrobium pneumaticum]|uniref:FSR family fosmidomycin resistance protein-like MFS transporter n=1 Tax=Prosthecomicrobium pneumaticum TaxID=81895 RepID=A0A7W9FNN7_9HYPH|nr:MFS transporter [Prosthecomicrobium pneumaticum]MBB5754054.1 FSR family fosmidomycin resistance protein-like MFS transporter [Prosthecomicrobium pneumaticum]